LRIGIIGCGIAGQAAAIALARDGHDVTVMERFAEARPVGAGLLLQPSGLIAMERLGLREAIKGWGAPVVRSYGRTIGGRTVMDLRYAEVGSQAHGLGVHRSALFGVLHDGLLVSGATVRLGFDAGKIEDPAAPTVLALNGERHGPFDLLVDCAGAHDTLRRSLGLRVSDKVYPWGALWTTCPDRSNAFPNELRQIYDSAKMMIGILPVGRVPGADGNHVALFWSLKRAEYEAQKTAGIGALKARILKAWPDAKPIVGEVASFDQFSLASYRDVAMPRWRKGRVLVMGDAAHGTSPQLGQGANLALIDTITLASALRQRKDVDEALALYEKIRRPHIRYYQMMSRAMTPVFQSDSRVTGWMRDLLFGPMAKTPGISHIMRTTLTGVRKFPLGLWKVPD
jgi:2-polyprenyl-6-methoxyphenol hydroxylase-like FAD-dependent oxidoreductase